MKELFNLSDTSFIYVDFCGIYPRINYVQESPPEEMRYWYNFRSTNSLYLKCPYFHHIKMLPQRIIEDVKNLGMSFRSGPVWNRNRFSYTIKNREPDHRF